MRQRHFGLSGFSGDRDIFYLIHDEAAGVLAAAFSFQRCTEFLYVGFFFLRLCDRLFSEFRTLCLEEDEPEVRRIISCALTNFARTKDPLGATNNSPTLRFGIRVCNLLASAITFLTLFVSVSTALCAEEFLARIEPSL